MNKKRIWLVIPSVILPYAVLAVLTLIFGLGHMDSDSFGTVFGTALVFGLLVGFLCLCALAATLNIICFICGLCKKWDSLSLAKTVMIIKLVQIPAYILIFVLGVMLAITIFTYPIAFLLIIFDCFSLYLSGLIFILSAINSVRQGKFSTRNIIFVIILQFIFCADVLASVIFYFKLKKRYLNSEQQSV